jgi:citryl-CoA lyase
MSEQRKTSLTHEDNGETHIRGYSLLELIQHATFSEAVCLLLTGSLPTAEHKNVWDAILVSAIDHGLLAPSADIARRVASTGNTVNTAVAAGISAIGDFHGGAIEQIGKLLQEFPADTSSSIDELAEKLLARGLTISKRIPGYGHKVYTTDPRVIALFAVAKENNLPDHYLQLARAVEKKLESHAGRKLCINIDGGMAAILSSLGISWQMFRGIFIIARTPGLVAHVYEQHAREKPVIRSTDEVVYDGPAKRPHPKSKKA